MKPRIGIIFPSKTAGGVHQYALSIAQSLTTYIHNFDYTIIHYSNEKPEIFISDEHRQPHYIALEDLNGEGKRALTKTLHYFSLATHNRLFLKTKIPEIAKRASIDILIYPTPLTFALPLDTPYIATIPDLMHKYYPHFPEYNKRNILKRNIIYTYFARHSLLNTVDSDAGARDVEKFLHTPAKKNRVIHYIPANYIYQYKNMTRDEVAETLKHFTLPSKFLFYPAQFWHQKNHVRLIEAIALIKKNKGVCIPLVLVGNATGNYAPVFRSVMNTAEHLGIRETVTHLGYVKNEEIVALYKRATALVAPPFQGPTTLLPLEAMILGTPIITTNIFDLPKQVGNAGLLFNPYSVEDIAEKIYMLWSDENLQKTLLAHGFKREQTLTQKHFAMQWKEVINESLQLYEHQSNTRRD